MTRTGFVVPLFAALLVTGGQTQTGVAPQEQNQAGMPTLAKVFILNRAKAEAVPVTFTDSDPLSVSLVGMPAMTAHAGRQPWEYKEIVLAAGKDAASTLNEAGLDGWEVVGVTPSGTSTRYLLKRPR